MFDLKPLKRNFISKNRQKPKTLDRCTNRTEAVLENKMSVALTLMTLLTVSVIRITESEKLRIPCPIHVQYHA